MKLVATLLTWGLVQASLTEIAAGQRLVTAITAEEVSIDSTFSGEALTLFGTIEPESEASGEPLLGPFDIVIVVRGPAVDRVARRKTNEWGLWINTEEALFESFPSFYQVIASAPLETVAAPSLLSELDILPVHQAAASLAPGTQDRKTFIDALLRLMFDSGHFGIRDRGVIFRSNQLYSARLAIPSDVPNGTFLTQTFVFRNGEVLARDAATFVVRKTGFERFLGSSARNQPLLYGFACVALAIGTGWLGGIVFKR